MVKGREKHSRLIGALSGGRSGGAAVPLRRGENAVSSILEVVGNLKETDLTAFLGWLVAHTPTTFADLFGDLGRIKSVDVEKSDDSVRHDITVVGSRGRAVVEAKRGF